MDEPKLSRTIREAPFGAVSRAMSALAALAFALASPAPAAAAQNGHLNVAITVQGIARITDLRAQTGSTMGTIDLTWTEPGRNLTVGPHAYQIRVSTTGQMNNEADFAFAQDLSVFSPTLVPLPGPGGAGVALQVVGLNPLTTYFFAIRQVDSDSPQHIGIWLRNVPQNWNVDNFARPFFAVNLPNAITDLTALPGTLEGEVALSWTAPLNLNGVPMASYDLRMATFSVASLGGNTTAWFNLAASSTIAVSPVQLPGSLETRLVTGLFPAATWYFAIKSADILGEVSPIDARASGGTQVQTLPRNFAPATPTGLAAAPGFASAQLSWTDLSPPQKGLDFAFYVLYRSTDDVSFAVAATTVLTDYTDFPLTPFATYYYRVAARDLGGFESPLSTSVFVVPIALPPMEPLGVQATASSTTVTLTWSPTTRFADGTPFVSSGAPTGMELQGYVIRRSTELCSAAPVSIATNTVAVTSFTDTTGGTPYFYQIRSFNTTGFSTATLVVSSLGDQNYFLDDCASRLQMTDAQASVLRSATNGLGGDIRIERLRRPQDTAGQNAIIQSGEWRALLNGVTVLPEFRFDSPILVFLHYLVVGGSPVPQTSAIASLSPEIGAAAGSPLENLGMFWHNGADFKKMYGRVDALNQTVSVATPNLGRYQIRTQLRSDGVVFDLSNVSSRVITPNGDGLNDLLIITYDPGPRGVQAEGSIYDLRGMRVASMTPGLVPNTIVWDGRSNGAPATGGVYIYQIKGDGKTFNGTIVIAR